jgi:hypothetical protein
MWLAVLELTPDGLPESMTTVAGFCETVATIRNQSI